MSKIVCDVCGTSYPETAERCPICNSTRPGDARPVSGAGLDPEEMDVGTYHYVKGGRFSKKNVKRRNREAGFLPEEEAEDILPEEEMDDEEPERSNKGLIITAITLVIAIAAVCIYIVFRMFGPGAGQSVPTTPTEPATEPSQTIQVIPCTSLVVTNDVIELNTKGAAWLLNVKVMPEDTTDELQFKSSDESVVTVSPLGKIQAVGSGEATVTVVCGSQQVKCNVRCTFRDDNETTEATEETKPVDTSDKDFKLNRKDITFSKQGDSWSLYSGPAPLTSITWKSDDEKVATVDNGKVEAVGRGTTKIHATYNDKTVECIIRCNFTAAPETSTGSGGNITEEGSGSNQPATGKSTVSHKDVTIKVGESFNLTVKAPDGTVAQVTWTAADGTVCAVSGNQITGSKKGSTTVSTTYEGETFSCIIRVLDK